MNILVFVKNPPVFLKKMSLKFPADRDGLMAFNPLSEWEWVHFKICTASKNKQILEYSEIS